MRAISVSEAKNGLSALLKEVRGGATVLITDRGVPIAQIAPMTHGPGLSPAAADLAQRGRLRLPAGEPSDAWLAAAVASGIGSPTPEEPLPSASLPSESLPSVSAVLADQRAARR